MEIATDYIKNNWSKPMESINKKSKLYRYIKVLIEDKMLQESEFPCSFSYSSGPGEPVFTFTVERKNEDYFIDPKGQKWIKAR
jgi:hypothetical protein